jgi:hypothetical protein
MHFSYILSLQEITQQPRPDNTIPTSPRKENAALHTLATEGWSGLSARQLAEQMTLYESEAFLKMTSIDFISHFLPKESKLVRYYTFFDFHLTIF